MQNPFTTTFSKAPQYTYIYTEKTDEILENFSYDTPSESVYKITGVRGSGKTVILAKVEEEYKREEVLKLMGNKSGNYSMYRDRLIKRGILNSRQGYISLALPYFAEYIVEYC